MVEVGVPIAIAALTGLAAVTTRLHGRIHAIDRRVDNVELRVAERYVSKTELNDMLGRVEAHMIRIEEKLDRMTRHN